MSLSIVIMAAGKGTRMKSARPKVLHELCGRPMIHFVVDAALEAGAQRLHACGLGVGASLHRRASACGAHADARAASAHRTDGARRLACAVLSGRSARRLGR